MFLPATEYQRQTEVNHRPLLFWLTALVIVLGFCSMIIAAPLATANGFNQFAFTIYHSFGVLCHQLPERSFFIAGHKFAVCARCTGIYAGFALAFLTYPLFRSLHSTAVPPRKWLFLAAVPLAIDFSLGFLDIWQNTHTSRLVTGLLLGSVAVFYVMPGIAELSLRSGAKVIPRTPMTGFTLASAEAIAAAPSDYSAPERRI